MKEPIMKYFVLKPKGTDEYATASRAAMRTFAESILSSNEELAHHLLDWANHEMHRFLDAREAEEPKG